MNVPPILLPFSSRNANDPSPPSIGIHTLKFFLTAPFRVLARLMWFDGLFDREGDPNQIMSSPLAYGTDGGVPMVHMASAPPTFPRFPGPWSFFASGYAVSLLAMALLLNRIQNIVVPGRRLPPHHTRSSPNLRTRWSLLRLPLPSVFPVDLSSTYSRVALRLPTMYYILKSLVLWSTLLLQASDRFPTSWKPFRLLDNWVAQREMDEICWFTFRAVCGALCVGALTKGLEGSGSTPASPFNLFGYSFMLHFYSSPLTHLVKPEGLPSRPDLNVIFTIYIPLFQLSMIHVIGAKKSWSNQRLVPTTICSVLTLAHFHWVLWFSPTSYPLLNYMSCIFESLLLLVIAVAFSLNMLTQLMLEGSITRPFIGHAASLMPKWDEDFSIVLLRLGIASLDATSVAGLGNEVSWIALADHAETTKKHQVQYGEAEMNRSGVSSITHMAECHGDRRTWKKGFANEIRRVKVDSATHGGHLVDATWFIEFKRFCFAIARCGIGLGRMAGRLLRGQPVFLRPPAVPDGQSHNLDAQPPAVFHEGQSKPSIPDQRDIYERFLSGEVLSDDEDDFSSPRSSTQSDDDDDEEEEEVDDDDEHEVDIVGQDIDTLALFSDLSAATTSATAPYLLAHMTDTLPSPLTRRRYRSMISGQEDPEQRAWHEFVNGKRESRDLSTNELRRNCVICTAEERQIICWPCRCLALCDDCRQNLASRLPASKHTCPCCRQRVEGFSRIYIP
ncbi:hypothetical protein F5148DRAFT_1196319 [Russula earlei]|uniref:Uncharacterized protein n=1 Tax=Russula earlei TaxID=71964 RepID=A0ACC0UBN5_9AGAM|nr:hypothetical protein F5148DRAFT_1196319 [Russula earlei]